MDAELMAEMMAEMERLRAENERLLDAMDAMVDMAMTLNKTAEYQVAELMAENDRLRDAINEAHRSGSLYEIDIIAKEALK